MTASPSAGPKRAAHTGAEAEDEFDAAAAPADAGGDDDAPGLRDAVVHHSLSGVFAIRRDSWKLVLGRGSGGFSQPKKVEPKPGEPAGQLYDLAADPGELNNVIDEHAEVAERLRRACA